MMIVVVLLIAVVTLSSMVIAIILRPSPKLSWYKLSFSEDLTADATTSFLRHLAAVRQGPVCLVIRAEPGQIEFFFAAPDSGARGLMSAMSGVLPAIRVDDGEELPVLRRAGRWSARVGWRGVWPLLRDEDHEQTAAGLLGALSAVQRGEQLEWWLRLWPVGRVNRPAHGSEHPKHPESWLLRFISNPPPPTDEVRPIRQKFSDLLIRAELLVVAGAGTEARAAELGHQLVVAARTSGGRRGVLRYRSRVDADVIERWRRRRRLPLPWELSTLLSPGEASGLTGWPLEAPAVSGIEYGISPQLMPPRDLPTKGRIFATSTFPATKGRLLAQPITGALQHSAIVGPTGSGKSSLILNLVAADMQAGRGAFVLDLKGDLVDDLLTVAPEHRRDDFIVLEPARGGAQPGLQLFPRGGEPELTADLVLGTLAEIFKDSWGIRSSQYLGLGLRTLATRPGSTLIELPLLFSDRSWRNQLLKAVTDPWLLAAWQQFAGLSAADQAQQLASPLTKLSELVSRSRLRLVLGQPESRLDFQEVLAHKKIVLVSLPPGLLGLPAVRLLSALTMWQFFQAVERRAGLAREQRSPFMAYVDEVAVLSDLPLPLEGILERARGHGVGLTLAPQALSQLSQSVRDSLLANVGSLAAFAQQSTKEAKSLTDALPGVSSDELRHLGRYEVAMRLSLGPGHITRTMTGRTLPPPERHGKAEAIRKLSAAHYGMTLEAVDAASQIRQASKSDQAAEPALGKRRRQS
jgi:hypothetical protein